MRPIYERDHDRVAQAQAIGALARATGTEAMPTPPLTFYDYEMLRDGKPVAIVEIKCRTRQYDPFWVSHGKMVRLCHEANQRELAGILLVRWPEMTGWLSVDRLDPESWATVTAGRTDRNDPKDIERMAEFPLAWFRMLEDPLDRLARLDEEATR